MTWEFPLGIFLLTSPTSTVIFVIDSFEDAGGLHKLTCGRIKNHLPLLFDDNGAGRAR